MKSDLRKLTLCLERLVAFETILSLNGPIRIQISRSGRKCPLNGMSPSARYHKL